MDALQDQPGIPRGHVEGPGFAVAACGSSLIAGNADDLVLLDGRIDNFRELADMLSLESADAANVLLTGWKRWGADLPEHLLGDFALAACSVSQRRVLLARDAGGRRPLYYWHRNQQLRFASQVCGLAADPEIAFALDQAKVEEWLCYYDTTDRTFFRDITMVPKGHAVLWDQGKLSLCRFWYPERIAMLRLRDPREYADGLRAVLTQSVACRLQETPLGVELSGGLDSSSTTAIAAGLLERQGGTLTAFTSVPVGETPPDLHDRFFHEGPYAAAVTRMYSNVEHTLVPSDCAGVFEALDALSSAGETPFLNPSNGVWMFGIMRQSRQRGLKALLNSQVGNNTVSWNGAGALHSLIRRGRLPDALHLAEDLHRDGMAARSLLRTAMGRWFPSRTLDLARHRGKQESSGLGFLSLCTDDFVRRHRHGIETRQRELQRGDSRELRLASMERADAGPIQAMYQRLGGVDWLDPTGDLRVVEYCLSVPDEQYLRNGIPRSLIRDAMAGLVPDQVLQERRKGLQGADAESHLKKERAEIIRELERARDYDLLRNVMDFPKMKAMVADWPAATSASSFSSYVLLLMRAISLIRFVRRVEDGSIFSLPV